MNAVSSQTHTHTHFGKAGDRRQTDRENESGRGGVGGRQKIVVFFFFLGLSVFLHLLQAAANEIERILLQQELRQDRHHFLLTSVKNHILDGWICQATAELPLWGGNNWWLYSVSIVYFRWQWHKVSSLSTSDSHWRYLSLKLLFVKNLAC